jgi:hypothetical protein
VSSSSSSDSDYALIAQVTGQPVQWIVPRDCGEAGGAQDS